MIRTTLLALVLGGAALASPIAAQSAEPNHSIVSTYRAAPGHQVALLKWFAEQDAISKAAGLPAAQLYVHQQGASWDFILIQPETTKAQDDAIDAAAKRMNLAVGPKVGLELRQHISEHTDTLSVGPISAADWLKRLGE